MAKGLSCSFIGIWLTQFLAHVHLFNLLYQHVSHGIYFFFLLAPNERFCLQLALFKTLGMSRVHEHLHSWRRWPPCPWKFRRYPKAWALTSIGKTNAHKTWQIAWKTRMSIILMSAAGHKSWLTAKKIPVQIMTYSWNSRLLVLLKSWSVKK